MQWVEKDDAEKERLAEAAAAEVDGKEEL